MRTATSSLAMREPQSQNAPRKYIVAHNRDRDYYQVAAALSEVDALQTLVTDYYSDGSGKGFDRILCHRSSLLIPREKTRSLPLAVLLQAAVQRFAPEWLRRRFLDMTDRVIGRAARDEAIAHAGTDLLIYSQYAREAFTCPQLADRRKILFMFHPHPSLLREILSRDVEMTGIGYKALRQETDRSASERILDDELDRADLVICASNLTARSVIHRGVDPVRVKVVPYGLGRTLPSYAPGRSSDKQRYLFVGQAVHRKGVHYLLDAWSKAGLRAAELVMVCSRVEDNLLDNLPERVVVKSALSTNELWETFCSAHCFVLPALAEGFGLVLIEALSAGCYTIFTENTGFADLGLPELAGCQVPAADSDALAEAFRASAAMFESGGFDHDQIHALSDEFFSAATYRENLRQALRQA